MVPPSTLRFPNTTSSCLTVTESSEDIPETSKFATKFKLVPSKVKLASSSNSPEVPAITTRLSVRSLTAALANVAWVPTLKLVAKVALSAVIAEVPPKRISKFEVLPTVNTSFNPKADPSRIEPSTSKNSTLSPDAPDPRFNSLYVACVSVAFAAREIPPFKYNGVEVTSYPTGLVGSVTVVNVSPVKAVDSIVLRATSLEPSIVNTSNDSVPISPVRLTAPTIVVESNVVIPPTSSVPTIEVESNVVIPSTLRFTPT